MNPKEEVVGAKTVISIDDAHMKFMLAYLVEDYMKGHLRGNIVPIIEATFPDMIGQENISLRFFNPVPNTIKEMGSSNGSNLYGWHGDLCLLIHSKEHGKRAIIFEIKFGHIHISKPQHKFFIQVKENCSAFMDKLEDVHIYIVNAFDFDVKNNCLSYVLYEYHYPEEREHPGGRVY